MTQVDLRQKPLAVLSGGKSTLPLMEGLSEKYSLAFLYPQAAQLAAGKNLPVADLAKLMGKDAQMNAMNVSLDMFAELTESLDDIIDGLVEEMRAEGIRDYSSYDQIKRSFRPRLFPVVGQSLLQLQAWEQVGRDFDVAVCVTHEDVMANTKTMCQFWRCQGIPTLHVPHGVYMDTWRGDIGEDVHDEITCEWIAASGSYQAEWYKARGAENVVVTGLPHWDGWAEQRDKGHAQRALKLNPDLPTVAFMSSWGQTTSALGMHGLVDASYRAFLAAAKDAEWQAVVKLHPGAGQESADAHIKLAQEAGSSCFLTPQYLELVLTAADLIVSAGPSNVVIEAAMCGVSSVSTYGYPDDDEVVTCEVGGLAKAIEEGLGLEVDLGAFVEKYAYCNDGKATERVLDLIEEIACQ